MNVFEFWLSQNSDVFLRILPSFHNEKTNLKTSSSSSNVVEFYCMQILRLYTCCSRIMAVDSHLGDTQLFQLLCFQNMCHNNTVENNTNFFWQHLQCNDNDVSWKQDYRKSSNASGSQKIFYTCIHVNETAQLTAEKQVRNPVKSFIFHGLNRV